MFSDSVKNMKIQFKKIYFLKVALFFSSISLLILVYSPQRFVLNTEIALDSIDKNLTKENTRNVNGLKYILQWTSPSNVPFVFMGKGQEGFVTRNCTYTNCFVTSNKWYLGDYTNFDVIAFAGPELTYSKVYGIENPEKRSPHQKYVFASIEASANYPICTDEYENFFNWTWTYRLDSEARWGYIVIRDLNNNIIGPRKDMNWLKPNEMIPVSDEFKTKLKTKKKAAAWFVSNCQTSSKREKFVRKLQVELGKYICGNTFCEIDIYGECGPYVCSRDIEKLCDKRIERLYYFYLSFENAFSEDYVTEKLLRALDNRAVPIVYGGANYTRFLPDGAYLDAVKLGVKNLAAKMHKLMNDPEEYAKYFKWKNHYYYHKVGDTVETNEYCRFCSLLNEDKTVKEASVYKEFRDWWNSPNTC